ncbi:hypothetical protein MKW92_014448 [Papaver armeniacum]|nr:hypothetical protein MKW92_014448 [Papaver armeniacum]
MAGLKEATPLQLKALRKEGKTRENLENFRYLYRFHFNENHSQTRDYYLQKFSKLMNEAMMKLREILFIKSTTSIPAIDQQKDESPLLIPSYFFEEEEDESQDCRLIPPFFFEGEDEYLIPSYFSEEEDGSPDCRLIPPFLFEEKDDSTVVDSHEQNPNWRVLMNFNKPLIEKERARVEAGKEARVKESVGLELQNEIMQLKSKITYLQETAYAREELLQTQISQGEAENKCLKELLEKEKKRGDAENKKAEVEKRKAAEALKLLIAELNKAEAEEKKAAEALKQSKLDGEKQLVDKDLIQKQVSDKVAEINRLKELLAKEKKRGDSEKKKAEAEKKKALESLKLLEAEKSKLDGEKKMVDIERNRAEELETSLEALKSEANEAKIKLGIERSKYEEAQKKLEAEKNKANREMKRADSEKAKAELQKRCAEEERKNLLKEEYWSDELSRRLEEEKKRSEELERKVQDIMYTEKVEKVSPEESDRQHENLNTNAANANMVFLEKHLELEKKHVKHAKKVAKFEKRRNDLLQQEICRLKQDLHQFCDRLSVLDGCFCCGVEEIDASAKGNFRGTETASGTPLAEQNKQKQTCSYKACPRTEAA